MDIENVSKKVEFLQLCLNAIEISRSELVSWEYKYDLIFSEHTSRRIYRLCAELLIPLDYYDPDTTYEEDVLAFTKALEYLVDDMLR